MARNRPQWTLADVARIVGGELCGDGTLVISGPVPTDSGDTNGIAFAESDAYLARAEAGAVGCLLVPVGAKAISKPHVKVKSPRQAFGMLLHLSQSPLPIESGVHPSAVVNATAVVDPSACVGAFVVVERGAVIGPRARIYPFTYVGEDCVVGEDSVLEPHVTLIQDVVLGDRCLIHSGAVIGADGFGFVWDGQRRVKVPQIGRVVFGNDVEFGANSTIDRATCGDTSVGSGSKFDNLVHVAHNVSIGEHSVFAAHVGISGSVDIGDRVTMAGGVGVKDHVSIGDDIVLGGRAGVMSDLTESGEYFGTPATPIRESLRQMVLIRKLPELFARMKEIERKLEES